MTEQPHAVFVYGTLKRGEVRERCWPRKPVAIDEANVRGALYDLGPYPGLVDGDDVVAGEVWRFAEADMQATLRALDEIEGFRKCENDEYRRAVITCDTAVAQVKAWTYLYARIEELQASRRVKSDEAGVCRWSKKGTRSIQTHG